MKDLVELSKIALEVGFVGALLVVLLLIIQEPARAEKLKALILAPTFRFFRWGSKQYLGAKVGGTVTEFLRNYIGRSILAVVTPRINIRWVSSVADPILSEDGTLILCLEDSNDQTRNILMATRVALPHIVCPTLRPYVGKHVGNAIDLAILHKLADGLGRHARPLFQRYFLTPELDAEERTAALFAKLIEIDSKGVFVFIFLEELNLLGESLFQAGDLSDQTSEVERFLEYLLALARRELGEEIETEFLSKEFKVGIVLVAKTAKAQTQGVVPYLKAVDSKIEHGCESIYLIGFPPSAKIFHRTLDALDADQRVAIEKRNRVRITPDMKSNFSENLDLAFARVIRYMRDASFEERLRAAGVKEGMRVEGVVLDITGDGCLVDVRGLRCTLRKANVAWNHVSQCSDVIALHDKISLVVLRIDPDKSEIEVSRRLPETDPWSSVAPPEVGETIEVTFTRKEGSRLFAMYKKVVEVVVPIDELSWLGIEAITEEDFLGASEEVLVIGRDDQRHQVVGSVRLTEENPWPQIHKRFPRGTELHGEVCEVTPHNVLVKLSDGLVGHIPRESLLKAGFEFASYEQNVVPGQGLDVVVTKVFLEKKRIRLDLKRNADAAQKKPRAR